MSFRKSLNWSDYFGNNGSYFLRTMTEDPQNSRKRPREDDSCEFMPLSKRINNLHLTSSMAISAIGIRTVHSDQMNGTECSPSNADHGISSPSSSNDSDQRPNYDPGIGASDSNYYFNNKLLFELHLERMQRTGQQYPY